MTNIDLVVINLTNDLIFLDPIECLVNLETDYYFFSILFLNINKKIFVNLYTVHIRTSLLKKHDHIAIQLVIDLKQNKRKIATKIKHDNFKIKLRQFKNQNIIS